MCCSFGLDQSYTPEEIERIQNDAINADAITPGSQDSAAAGGTADAPIADAAAGPSVDPTTLGKRKDRTQDEMTAEVWKHFLKSPRRADGFYEAKCVYCGKSYKMGKSRGTASLRHHIFKRGCKKLPKGLRFPPDALQRMLVDGPAAGITFI
jgi:hypothetical protein